MKLVDRQRGTLRSKRPAAKALAPVPDKLITASKRGEAAQRDRVRSKHAYPSVPLKIHGLEPVLVAIVQATYAGPTTNDSPEVRRQKMEEANFNARLLHVVREATQLATPLYQRQSAAIAGPYSHAQAQELAHLLDKAYSGRLAPIDANPHMDDERASANVHPPSKLSAKAIFPITSEKLKKTLTQEAKKAHPYPPVSILVAPKKLVVTICEKQTCADVEKEFRERHHELKKARSGAGSAGGGDIDVGGNVLPVRSSCKTSGSSTSVVIQELI